MESRRLFWNGKLLLFLLGSLVVFWLVRGVELRGFVLAREEMPEETAQQAADYIRQYNRYFEKIEKDADQMLGIQIFSGENSFSSRNIKKTLEDFRGIRDWKLSSQDTGAEEALFESPVIDYMLFFLTGLLVVGFLQERKCGMWKLAHASGRGRGNLALRRIGILIFWSGAVTILLWLVNCAVTEQILGRKINWELPVQSLPRFRFIPKPWTIGAYMARYLPIRIAALAALGLVLWLLLSTVRNANLAMVFTGFVMAAEYGLYTLLPDGSAAAVAKYLNTYLLIQPQKLFEKYLNLKLWNYPVNAQKLFFALLPAASAGCAVLLVLCQIRIYPVSHLSWIEKLWDHMRRRMDRVWEKIPFWGMELYKTIVPLKGWVAVLLLAYFVKSYTGVPANFVDTKDYFAQKYYRQFSGEVTEGTLEELSKLLERGREKPGEAAGESLDGRGGNTAYYQAVDRVLEEARWIYDKNQETGSKLQLVPPYAFQGILDSRTAAYHQFQNTELVLLTLLLFGGIFVYEREKRVKKLILASGDGGSRLFWTKLLANGGMFLLLSALFWGMELHSANQSFGGFSELQAPAASLSFLEGTIGIGPEDTVPLWLVLVFLYLTRSLILGLVFGGICFFSQFFRRSGHIMLVGLLVLALPMVLTYIGYPQFASLSLTTCLEPRWLLKTGWGVPAAALLGIGGELYLAKRKFQSRR